ncbi:MAG TPA: response regulator, partial [Myxococcaceae bacterium]|nr:response regulator [Myxococcaceae bacterium]
MRRTRVLVVDDEPLVASAARRLLARAHEVHVAHNGQTALAMLEQGTFDAVLCDIMMPHMTGP